MTCHIDKEMEGEFMLPVEDMLDLQGDGDGRIFTPDGASVNAEELISFVTNIVMSPYNPSRDPKAVIARELIAYRMHLDGVGCTRIGWLLRKNHATIIHYIYRMEDALAFPRAFKEINRYWKAVLIKPAV